ncbi:TonB-dependent receptor [Noviherbaspirillum sp.]|jgi:iron complex outermembrane receptor protein|uniref:TonB-dependent receptor plug domain-containing protein n=1 Tax=Noviherbaspirillum sp. TaxID=1926288 RepID=UPI0025D98A02|nr:TonB-dependent receptor [Noviherbaspirillum sp.]
MRTITSKVLCASIALSWYGQLHAESFEEEDFALVYGDKYTVSIATGSQQHIRRAPAVASVITAEDIAATGAIDLDEVLETVPGLHVSRSANFNSPLYAMRGVISQYTPQVLMLQNGIPVTTLFIGNKGNLWGGLPLENVARIEIIRGPGSALYGADAFSGVINIITKTAADTSGTQVGVRGGSFNTGDAWVLHGGKLGSLDVAAYFRAGATDGFKKRVTEDAQSRNDAAFGTRASLAPGFTNNQQNALDASVDLSMEKWRWRNSYKLRDEMGTGIGVGSALDPVGRGKTERLLSDLSWSDPQISDFWGATLTASYMEYKQRFPVPAVLFPPGVTFPTGSFPNGMIGGPETSERQLRLAASATYQGLKRHNLRFGVGHDDLDLYDAKEIKNFTFSPSGVPVPVGALMDFTSIAPFLTPHRRTVSYVYAQDEWRVATDWALTAGVRHDRYSDFGTTTNPRLALVWDASLDLTAKLLFGHAFRAPAFVEEYSINNPVVRGNSNLRPETTKTLEAAFSWQARKDAQVNLNFFRYDMSDIIRTVPNGLPGTGSTYNNTGGQHGSGMELEVEWDYSRSLRVTGNYSYQKSIDESTGQDAGYAPHHHFYLRGDWRYTSGWLASAQINRVMDRKRTAGDIRPPVPDYTMVDVTVRSNAGSAPWTFSASVRNLFNATVLEPSLAPGTIRYDLPMAPRAFWLQLVYRI